MKATCRYVSTVCMHKKEPQKLPEHTSEHVKHFSGGVPDPPPHTRQMIIIAGGEPELCRRRHAKREGGVYAAPYALRVRKPSCPECSVHVLCLCRKV